MNIHTHTTRHSLFRVSTWKEARLIWVTNPEDKHKDELAEGLEARMATVSAPATVTDSLKRMQQATDIAVNQVQTVGPTVRERLSRFALRKAGGVVGIDIMDANAKNIDTTITDMTKDRVQLSQQQLEIAGDESVGKINDRITKSTLSVGFLLEKQKVAGELLSKLDERRKQLEKLKSTTGASKGVVTAQIQKLAQAVSDTKAVSAKVKEQLGQTERAVLLSEVENANGSLEQLFTTYLDSGKDLTQMLLDYAQGRPGDLRDAFREIAEKMHPNDPSRQKQRVQILERMAEVFKGKEQTGTLRWFGRRLKDTAPGLAVASMAALPGAGILAGGLAARMAYNKYKFGTPNQAGWEQQQIQSYLLGKKNDDLSVISGMLSENDPTKRIAKLKELKPGAKIQVVYDNQPLTLKIGSKNDTQVFATDEQQNAYSFDITGRSGKHYFTRKDGNQYKHSLIACSKDVLFAMAA